MHDSPQFCKTLEGRPIGPEPPFKPGFCLQKPRSWERKGGLERVKGIEPSYSAWKAAALPLSYTRAGQLIALISLPFGGTGRKHEFVPTCNEMKPNGDFGTKSSVKSPAACSSLVLGLVLTGAAVKGDSANAPSRRLPRFRRWLLINGGSDHPVEQQVHGALRRYRLTVKIALHIRCR